MLAQTGNVFDVFDSTHGPSHANGADFCVRLTTRNSKTRCAIGVQMGAARLFSNPGHRVTEYLQCGRVSLTRIILGHYIDEHS